MLRFSLKRESRDHKHHAKKSRKSKAFRQVLDNEKPDADIEHKELEKLVFGGEDEVLEELAGSLNSDSQKNITENKQKARKAAWEDEDDIAVIIESNAKEESYVKHLRKKLVDQVGNPKWAQLGKIKSQESDDSDEEILKTSRNLLSSSHPLKSGNIDVRSCKDLNNEGWTKGIIKSTKFHPSSQVALVANCNGTVTLFQVDGKSNPKIQAVHFERFSLESAHFTTDGEHIIVGSPDHSHLFYYDMMIGKIVKVPWSRGIEHCSTQRLFLSPDGKFLVIGGRFGEIHLVTVKSKEWVGSLKMNGEVRAIAFADGGCKMYSHGENGEVYLWDLRSHKCLSKFQDEGCIYGSSLSVSPNGQYLAAGSDSGVVNIYNTSDLHQNSNPKPLKAILNLTTEVTALKFNHTSEILAMASSHNDNAVKLLHVPTTSVFSNFPLFQQSNLRRVNSLDISLNSGYLTFGNNMGRASLYRLKHFSNF